MKSAHLDKCIGLVRGLLACAIIGLAALFLAEHYPAPTMLFALLLGMSANFLYEKDECSPGINFAASTILRFGVVLLGANILAKDVIGLGWTTLVLVVSGVVATIVFGLIASKLLRLESRLGMLTGGAVAVCGISAAITLSSVMPNDRSTERYTLVTVVLIAAFGALSMVLYPILVPALDFTPNDAALFIGGSIHDVSHVVGASYSISPDIGYTAMLIKMLRVSLLLPITWAFFVSFKDKHSSKTGTSILTLPFFLFAFVAVVVINNLKLIPVSVANAMSTLSQGCFILAIVALGIKTSLKGMLEIGWRPVLLVMVESIFLGCIFLTWILVV